jgi:hypothetical protein
MNNIVSTCQSPYTCLYSTVLIPVDQAVEHSASTGITGLGSAVSEEQG